jgi:two-component system NtrC family response regulator
VFELERSVETTVRPGETLRESLQRIEALLIQRALDTHDGRRAETARNLGITREGLWRKMRRYGIT